MPTCDTDLEATFSDIFRNASLRQTCEFSGQDSLSVVDMEQDFQLGQVISSQMTLIVVSGAEMSIFFRIHFKNSEGDRLRRMKFTDSPASSEVAAAKTADYMKELTNQIGGRICRILQHNNLTFGMCIPLSMRGFYELYSDYSRNDRPIRRFGQAWRIAGDFGSFVCTANVEITNLNAVANLQYTEEQASDDDGDLEFL